MSLAGNNSRSVDQRERRTIRQEQPGDEAAISCLIERAFGQADEATLVAQLRAGGDAMISLVALADATIAGHVMLSRMTAPFRALGLAPVSVAPGHQRIGIGRSLIAQALAQAREQGWEAVFVLGNPAYYQRFGFRSDLASGFASPYNGPHFMALSLVPDLPARTGRVDYAKPFERLGGS